MNLNLNIRASIKNKLYQANKSACSNYSPRWNCLTSSWVGWFGIRITLPATYRITSYIQSIKFNFILENNAAVKISKQSKPYIFRCSEFISTWNCSKCVLVCSSSVTVQEHLNFLTLDYFFIPSSVPRTTPRCTTWNPSTTHRRELATVGTTEHICLVPVLKCLPSVVRSP